MRRRIDIAVGLHSDDFDDRDVIELCPNSLGVASLGIEDPRLELTERPVPANSLSAALHFPTGDLNGEIADEEIAVVRPARVGMHRRLTVFVNPIADQPLKALQVCMGISQIPLALATNASQQPTPIRLPHDEG